MNKDKIIIIPFLLFAVLIAFPSIETATLARAASPQQTDQRDSEPDGIASGYPGDRGIQGDEPGGFTAASMLVTNYKVTKGNIWVVPNLNFESIIKRSRGVHGDMNRKFKTLSKDDPEFHQVQKIKRIILLSIIFILISESIDSFVTSTTSGFKPI